MNNNPFFTQDGNLMLRIEQFDWLSPDEQTSIKWHITSMQLAITAGQLPYTNILAYLDQNFARDWLTKRELNMDYVRKIPKARINIPVIGCRMPDADERFVLVDGSHRYYRRYLDGCRFVPYQLIETKDWLPFADIKGLWPCT